MPSYFHAHCEAISYSPHRIIAKPMGQLIRFQNNHRCVHSTFVFANAPIQPTNAYYETKNVDRVLVGEKKKPFKNPASFLSVKFCPICICRSEVMFGNPLLTVTVARFSLPIHYIYTAYSQGLLARWRALPYPYPGRDKCSDLTVCGDKRWAFWKYSISDNMQVYKLWNISKITRKFRAFKVYHYLCTRW